MPTLQHKKLLRGAERRLQDYVIHPVRQRAHHVRYAMRMLFLAPLISSAVIFGVLAFVPQLHEVYRGIIDEYQFGFGLLGLLTLFLLSALLLWWNAGLNTAKIDALYLNHADLGIDRSLGAFRDIKSFLCASAPLTGLLTGLAILYARTMEDSRQFQAAVDTLGLHMKLAEELGAMRALPWNVLSTAVTAGLLSLFFLVLLLRLRASSVAKRWVLYGSTGLTAVMVLLPVLDPARTISHYAMAPGPLALAGFVLIASTALVIGLTTLSRMTRLPVITGLIIVGVLLAYGNIVGNVAVPDPSAFDGNEALNRGNTALTAKFRDWLEHRRDLGNYRGQAYPVLIFSVQGGGIYAASEGASYLSRLADLCHAFDHHVFAISAVSGGAIGSTIFNGLVGDQKTVDSDLSCTGTPDGGMAQAARNVVRADHLSPVMAFLLPDLLRKVVPFRLEGPDGLENDRAAALAESFARAYATALGYEPWARTRLRRPFDDHWEPRKSPPALLLNATSVEAGHRVAFAPFKLSDAGDGTLFAMSELDPRLRARRLGLIDTAVISARIPGIIPTWRFPTGSVSNPRHWNFVDGGYADGSGASTALDVFREIAREIQDAKQYQWLPGGITDVDLRLVMLTDSGAAPRFDDLNGSGFSEAVVTLTTLLNVRKLLSSRAVTQAATEVERLNLELGKPTQGSRVLIVRLEHNAFPLSLGWKISKTSDSIIQLLLGDPNLCPESGLPTAAPRTDAERAVAAITNNSCATRQIISLLRVPQ